MGKPESQRKHGQQAKNSHILRKLTPSQIREEKIARCRIRSAERKQANLDKMAKMVHRDPFSQLRELDNRLGKNVGAKKERAKLAEKISKAKVDGAEF